MPRKSEGTPTGRRGVRRLGPGLYLVRVYVTDPKTGKPKEKRRVVEASSAAEADAERHRLREREPRRAERRTFHQHALSWLERVLPALKPSTQSGHAGILDAHLLPALGPIFLDALEPSDIARMRDSWTCAPATAASRLRLCRTILEAARKEGLVKTNAAASVPAPRARRSLSSEYGKGYTLDELPRVLDAVRSQRAAASPKRKPDMIWPLVQLLAWTGLRFGEATALRWADLDLDGRTAWIERSQVRGAVTSTKTEAGIRRVGLPEEVVSTLRAHRAAMLRHQHPGLAEGLVFAGRFGGYLHTGRLSRPMQKARKAAGIKRRVDSAHGFRHTYQTMLRRAGVDEITRRAVFGHDEKGRAEDRYTALGAEESRDVADLVRRIVE